MRDVSSIAMVALRLHAHHRSLPVRRGRGFTVVEMVVALAIIGVIASLTAWGFNRQRARRSLDDAARDVVAQIYRLRSRAVSGRLARAGVMGTVNASLDDDVDAILQTGLRIVDDRTISFFTSPDGAATEVFSAIDLSDRYPAGDLRVTAPAPGTEIRFERNATLAGGSDDTITLTDQESGREIQIRITLTGVPRII